MRALAVNRPILTARDALISIFEKIRTKAMSRIALDAVKAAAVAQAREEVVISEVYE